MSSHCALQMYEVSLKYVYVYQVIERTRLCDGHTHRQTDRQTDARGKTICLPTLAGGEIDMSASEGNRQVPCMNLFAAILRSNLDT